MPTSAIAKTVVTAVEELFCEFASLAEVETVAVSVSVVWSAVEAGTWTVRRNVALAPAARLALLQEIVPAAPAAGVVQVKPASESSDLNVVPGGRGLVRVTSAAFGPAFVTVIGYSRSSPAVTVSDAITFTPTSAGGAGAGGAGRRGGGGGGH